MASEDDNPACCSRMADDEGEGEEPEVQLRQRRRRRTRRRTRSSGHAASFAVPKKTALHWRSQADNGRLTCSSSYAAAADNSDGGRRRRVMSGPEETNNDDGTDCSSSSPFRSRDLSPVVSQMKGYLSDADELLEEVLEKIVHRAENASAAMVHNASEMVHRSRDAVKTGVHHASEMVQSGAHQASEMVHHASEMVHTKVHQAEELAKDVYERMWKACHFEKLPPWMRDNEFLHFGHRPELKSFAECFKSIFRIHTETGNIWTHLIGFVAFVVVTIVFYVQPLCATCKLDIQLSEKLVFLTFFIGAILCLACSTLFHTLSCHSEFVSGIFSRLDYAGIAFLIVGSIIPWLYYSFYCQFYTKLTYIVAIVVVGVATIVLTMWDRFNRPEFRVHRVVTFVSLAGVSVAPCAHYMAQRGISDSFVEASMHWTITMGALYLTGAALYAARIPERFMPGKCDIWFQSHQIFHVLVIAAAFVHYRGISEMAMYRLKNDAQCTEYWSRFEEQVQQQVQQEHNLAMEIDSVVGAVY